MSDTIGYVVSGVALIVIIAVFVIVKVILAAIKNGSE
jgi:hypothetical protein